MPRISSLPRILACPSSAMPTNEPYSPQSVAADAGAAAHSALQCLATGVEPDIERIASEMGVDADETEFMYSAGKRAWAELRELFPSPRAEEPLEGDGIRGTADVFSNDGSSMAVLDWKSGRVRRDSLDQVRGYATAAVEQYGIPESGYVTVIIVWLRFGEYELRRFDARDIKAFRASIASAKRNAGKAYDPGEACTFCPRQLSCRSRIDFMRSASESIALLPDNDMLPPGEILAKLYERTRCLKKTLSRYEDALRVALRDGALSDGDGGKLELTETSRDKIDAREAWPVLTDAGYSADDLAGCMTVGKTAMLKVVSDTAKRGEKGKAKLQLMDRLKEAGAVKSVSHETISHTRAKK